MSGVQPRHLQRLRTPRPSVDFGAHDKAGDATAPLYVRDAVHFKFTGKEYNVNIPGGGTWGTGLQTIQGAITDTTSPYTTNLQYTWEFQSDHFLLKQGSTQSTLTMYNPVVGFRQTGAKSVKLTVKDTNLTLATGVNGTSSTPRSCSKTDASVVDIKGAKRGNIQEVYPSDTEQDRP